MFYVLGVSVTTAEQSCFALLELISSPEEKKNFVILPPPPPHRKYGPVQTRFSPLSTCDLRWCNACLSNRCRVWWIEFLAVWCWSKCGWNSRLRERQECCLYSVGNWTPEGPQAQVYAGSVVWMRCDMSHKKWSLLCKLHCSSPLLSRSLAFISIRLSSHSLSLSLCPSVYLTVCPHQLSVFYQPLSLEFHLLYLMSVSCISHYWLKSAMEKIKTNHG